VPEHTAAEDLKQRNRAATVTALLEIGLICLVAAVPAIIFLLVRKLMSRKHQKDTSH